MVEGFFNRTPVTVGDLVLGIDVYGPYLTLSKR